MTFKPSRRRVSSYGRYRGHKSTLDRRLYPGGVSTPPRAQLLLVQGPDGTGYALASNTRYTTTGWIKENPTRQILLVVYRGGTPCLLSRDGAARPAGAPFRATSTVPPATSEAGVHVAVEADDAAKVVFRAYLLVARRRAAPSKASKARQPSGRLAPASHRAGPNELTLARRAGLGEVVPI